MRQIDLFAGIGGISLAAEWAGIETVAFCEKEPFAQKVLRRRFPGVPIYDDVFHLTREVLERDGVVGGERGIDIVAGGFPCQPFSHAGKRAGTADDRYLWPEMCRIVGELRPSWVFAENVDGLVSMAQSDWESVMEDETTLCEEAEMVLETIRKDLEAIGYQSVPVIVPACGVGATHRRYRVFIVAYSEIIRCNVSGKITTSKQGSKTIIADARRTRENGAILADPEGKRRNAWGPKSAGQQRESGSAIGDSSLAHTSGTGREERDVAAVSSGSGHSSGCGDSFGGNRPTQPGMGGSPYELSDWLDGFGMNPIDALFNFISAYPQPALMGQKQHEWEPPRVTGKVKDRVGRLKALGNAVDPLQALPVLYGIKVIHDYLLSGGVINGR